jgi:L-amino acid N-acyltransferase YncA
MNSRPEPRVRNAEPGDSPRIAEIYNQSILARDSTMDTEPVSGDVVLEWVRGLGAREYLGVVELEARITAWGIVRRYHPRPGYRRAAETSVYVDRSLTGQGYGSAMQTVLMEFCRQNAYHHIVAKIWAANDGSIRMHQRFGFELVGIQREIGYVDGQSRDIAILQCVLG